MRKYDETNVLWAALLDKKSPGDSTLDLPGVYAIYQRSTGMCLYVGGTSVRRKDRSRPMRDRLHGYHADPLGTSGQFPHLFRMMFPEELPDSPEAQARRAARDIRGLKAVMTEQWKQYALGHFDIHVYTMTDGRNDERADCERAVRAVSHPVLNP